MECPYCDYQRAEFLGCLGPHAWLRCKACGWEYTVPEGDIDIEVAYGEEVKRDNDRGTIRTVPGW